ncbi:MAG: 3-hydroxyacyl-CoA dehydrogenase, partial [Burkholderiaceae bacterium]|nr:3-hydroxyacyl-CoA dehydrogenase [Burkholderiaceae bacterium]
MKIQFLNVGIVGTGAMGRGIAQIAAQAGSQVFLFDTQADAAQTAKTTLQSQWGKLVTKGRLTTELADALTERVHPVATLGALGHCDLVIEAIVEQLDAKKALLGALETIVAHGAVL